MASLIAWVNYKQEIPISTNWITREMSKFYERQKVSDEFQANVWTAVWTVQVLKVSNIRERKILTFTDQDSKSENRTIHGWSYDWNFQNLALEAYCKNIVPLIGESISRWILAARIIPSIFVFAYVRCEIHGSHAMVGWTVAQVP